MKTVGIILIVLQILSFLGGGISIPAGGGGYALGYMLGRCLFGIIGVILLIAGGRKTDENAAEKPEAAPTPRVPKEDWTCASCGMVNKGHIASCQGCGVTKAWSDSKTKEKNTPGKALPAKPEPAAEPVVPPVREEPPVPEQEEKPEVILPPVIPPQQPETTRWICPKCGLVHSKVLTACFHCGTEQKEASRFV